MRVEEGEAYGERDSLGIDIGSILCVEHVVQSRDLAFRVGDLEDGSGQKTVDHPMKDWTYDGELDVGRSRSGAPIRVDVLDPFLVASEVVGRETDDLDVLGLEEVGAASNLSELRRTDL